VREGVLFERMPDDLRLADPLIEACRHLEAAQARLPGFGQRLYDFLMPLYRNQPPERLRLVKAACLLHDVNWRAHPDYRSESCFDTATRANLGGLDHRGRVYLGLALMNRYKTAGADNRLTPLLKLLSEDEIRNAIMLGRAMRFGAMFSVGGDENPGELRFFPKKQVLELVLNPERRALFGEVAESRFTALAKTLGVSSVVRVARAQSSKGAVTGGGASGG
jgi:exopolyphosphatase/guanosine-5'-triphosphate,3'-diphosphate pyrophosphatase